MSIVNLGTQTINWKYKTSLKGSNLSRMFNGCISPGIYLNNGSYIQPNTGLITSYAGNQITINAFEAVFKASTTQTVHIGTSTAIALSTDGGLGYITESYPYITMSYSWADQIINYIDFAFKAAGSITAYDLIIGKAIFTGGVVTSIDYSEATYPISYNPQTNLSTSYGGLITRERDILKISITNADVTLTAEQALYKTILLSGTLTGNRNLVIPDDYRDYNIINNCTGAYYVTIKTSAGTGVYSAPGDVWDVYCDGTNIKPVSLLSSTREIAGELSTAQTIPTSVTTTVAWEVAGDALSEMSSGVFTAKNNCTIDFIAEVDVVATTTLNETVIHVTRDAARVSRELGVISTNGTSSYLTAAGSLKLTAGQTFRITIYVISTGTITLTTGSRIIMRIR